MTNAYSDESKVQAAVAVGKARDLIGGLWEELGSLQAEFLSSHGLRPDHRVLDVGCGCLRAGVKLVPLVDSGNYYGIDLSESLLGAGRQELVARGLSHRVPETNLRATGDFDISGFPDIDLGVAQSVFTHIPLEIFSRCLAAIRPNFAKGGRFYATFFVGPPGAGDFRQPSGIVTHCGKDPFHFSIDQIVDAAASQGWAANWVGDWSHPRSQQIAEFVVGR